VPFKLVGRKVHMLDRARLSFFKYGHVGEPFGVSGEKRENR